MTAPEDNRTVNFRLSTPDDMHLATYDNTKLVAINTCPTWGILRYQMHKRMGGSGRALALECGSAMHEVFAWVRLCTLAAQQRTETATSDVWNYHGARLFGKERFQSITQEVETAATILDMCKRGAIAVLDTCGYYDDPRDKRRTLSNMEECAYAYIDRWKWDQHVWMRNPNDPFGDVGIEIPFDVVVEVQDAHKAFRYTGKIDGIHYRNHTHTTLVLHDNKTAARLNDAWSMQWALASQITGYCLAASVFTEQDVRQAEVLGLSIPLPKTYDYGGIVREPVTRKDYHFTRWVSWLLHTIKLCEENADNPYDAPKYTHSCNRYFRSCSLIPFCDSDVDEQRLIVKEMEHDEWSPLHPVVEGET